MAEGSPDSDSNGICIVPTDLPGVKKGKPLDKVGKEHSTREKSILTKNMNPAPKRNPGRYLVTGVVLAFFFNPVVKDFQHINFHGQFLIIPF